jgi:hypothetical protein
MLVFCLLLLLLLLIFMCHCHLVLLLLLFLLLATTTTTITIGRMVRLLLGHIKCPVSFCVCELYKDVRCNS